jgi:uncharacterized protein YndB with AHSA1/START domain
VPRYDAARELLASREDVWSFLAEPHNLPDWWPGIRGVKPDRRGLAPGARWQVHGLAAPSLIRRPDVTGTMVVLEVERPRRVAWMFAAERLSVELRLDATAEDRTRATLTVEGPWLVGLRRSLPRQALNRLYALCQTGAAL